MAIIIAYTTHMLRNKHIHVFLAQGPFTLKCDTLLAPCRTGFTPNKFVQEKTRQFGGEDREYETATPMYIRAHYVCYYSALPLAREGPFASNFYYEVLPYTSGTIRISSSRKNNPTSTNYTLILSPQRFSTIA
jgi:hypothetical protein